MMEYSRTKHVYLESYFVYVTRDLQFELRTEDTVVK